MSTDKEYLDRALDFSDDFEEEKPEKTEELKTIEKKDKKELKKYEGRKNVTSVQKKKKQTSTRVQKKLVSISEKNKQVLDILENLDKKYTSESEYICQAIIEKFERDSSKDEKSLKDSIKEVLEEMVGEKFIVMKSSSDVVIPTTSPATNIQPKEEIPTNNNDSDSADLIRGALDMWDEE